MDVADVPDTVALVLAHRRGERHGDVGPNQPWALRPLAGEPLVVHAVRRLAAAGGIGAIVVAVPAGAAADVRTALDAALEAGLDAGLDAVGHRTVQVVEAPPGEAVAAALAVGPSLEPSVVLVHDLAWALVGPKVVDAVVAAVRAGHPAVVPVRPLTDTVKRVDSDGVVAGTLDRDRLRVAQAPWGFRPDVLRAARAAPERAADRNTAIDPETAAGAMFVGAAVARLGVRVHPVDGAETVALDDPLGLAVAGALLEAPRGGARRVASSPT